MPRSIISIGSGTPITPVELTSTRSGVVPSSRAAAAAMRRALLDALLTGGDVAHLAVRRRSRAAALPHRLAAEDDRRAGKLIAREHRRRVGVDVAREQREVLRRRLEPEVAAGAAEATGKDGAVVKHGRWVDVRGSLLGRAKIRSPVGRKQRSAEKPCPST